MESVSSCLSGLFSVSGAGPEGRTASGSVSAHTVQLCCTALKWVRFGFVYACQSVAFHNHHRHLFYLLVFLTEDGSGYRRIPSEFSGIFQNHMITKSKQNKTRGVPASSFTASDICGSTEGVSLVLPGVLLKTRAHRGEQRVSDALLMSRSNKSGSIECH